MTKTMKILGAAAAAGFLALVISACDDSKGVNNAISDIEKNCGAKTRECTVVANEYRIAGNTKKALDLFNKACEGKEGAACYEMALVYHKGGVDTKVNIPLAFSAYEKGCKLGHTESCNILAILQIGVGQEKNSFENYEKSCEGNNANACFNTAVNFYMNGFDGKDLKMEADIQKYAQLLGKACELGQPQACDMLSAELFTGERIGKDRNAMGMLCHRACDINDGPTYTECNRQCDIRIQLFDQQNRATNAPASSAAPKATTETKKPAARGSSNKK